MKILQSMKIAAVAATVVLAAAMPACAADTVSADDTARFLAGMPPSADSPLTPLTKDPAWQRHAKFFDAAFGQRPFRVHYDPTQDGAEVVNMVSDRVRAELLRRIGLRDALTPRGLR